jgi:hypothetical protein
VDFDLYNEFIYRDKKAHQGTTIWRKGLPIVGEIGGLDLDLSNSGCFGVVYCGFSKCLDII